MSGTLNKVMLIGHTGDEVTIKHFEGGNCVGNFSMATNETYVKKETGEKVTNTEWHRCVVRNKGAEICEKYLKKGDKVYVEGKIKTRKWTDTNGIERYSTEIAVDNFTFLTPKGNESGAGTSAHSTAYLDKQSAAKAQQHAGDDFLAGNANFKSAGGEDEDDLPY